MSAQRDKLAIAICELWPIIGLANLPQLIFKPLTFTWLYRTTSKNDLAKVTICLFCFDIRYFKLCVAYYISYDQHYTTSGVMLVIFKGHF